MKEIYRVGREGTRCYCDSYSVQFIKNGEYIVKDKNGIFRSFSVKDKTVVFSEDKAMQLYNQYKKEAEELKVKIEDSFFKKDNENVFVVGDLKNKRGGTIVNEHVKNNSFKGSVIDIEDTFFVLIDGEEEKYKIKHATVAYIPNSKKLDFHSNYNLENGEINEFSPLAKAVIGKGVGDNFVFEVNGRFIRGVIRKIEKER